MGLKEIIEKHNQLNETLKEFKSRHEKNINANYPNFYVDEKEIVRTALDNYYQYKINLILDEIGDLLKEA